MPVLSTQQRSALEKAVIKARGVAEVGARNALQALAVDHHEPFMHMTPEQRTFRNRLRNKARLLGDELQTGGQQQINHLSYELAYEYWHKMLFARFLEANGLLMHPSGVAVTLEECEELAPDDGYANKWIAAAHYASAMLPAIFRPDDALMQIEFATNDRIALETILDGLQTGIFTADDSLGWVYQFWQSEEKANINKSGDKINGEKLPAVTQLFTEPYMVHFLIDNTLGAWWVSRHPGVTPPVAFEYLRTLEDGKPAAGSFAGWPTTTKEVTVLDPCMGSGHFIATLFSVLAQLRMHEEKLSAEEATDRVIAENLHGLELDPRCTQIAAFNLALTAWKFCDGYKSLPEMNLACSGIAPRGKSEDWEKLAGTDQRLRNGMKLLYQLFSKAPELGSLLEPDLVLDNSMAAKAEELLPALEKAIAKEKELHNDEQVERGVMAKGIAFAAKLLTQKYTLQITNVPYLNRLKQANPLASFCQRYYPDAKNDIATVFLDRMLKAANVGGIVCTVIPQNWLFLGTYKKFREKLLLNKQWSLIAKLGAKGFQTPMWDFNVMLISIAGNIPDDGHTFYGMDVSTAPTPTEKDQALQTVELSPLNQKQQHNNPDSRIVLDVTLSKILLQLYSDAFIGQRTGDGPRFIMSFWERDYINTDWVYFGTTVFESKYHDGCSQILLWEQGKGQLEAYQSELAKFVYASGGWKQGWQAWGRSGIRVSQMGNLPVTLHTGSHFDNNSAVIVPKKESHLAAIWEFCSSPNFNTEVRKIDQKLNVTNATLVKIPFDLEYWQKVAEEKHPKGLPKPYSDAPTQWLFHGRASST